jgi:predicted DNA-binding transcriptional regulator AlpA
MDGRGFLREKDLMKRLGVKSRVTIWRWVDRGYLPPPRALGPTKSANVWLADEIDQWMAARPVGGKNRSVAALDALEAGREIARRPSDFTFARGRAGKKPE